MGGEAVNVTTEDGPALLLDGPRDHLWLPNVPKGTDGVTVPIDGKDTFAYYALTGSTMVAGERAATFEYRSPA
jgi:hypothetical protein